MKNHSLFDIFNSENHLTNYNVKTRRWNQFTYKTTAVEYGELVTRLLYRYSENIRVLRETIQRL